MVEITLEQKIEDFHNARQELAQTNSQEGTNQPSSRMESPTHEISKDDAFEIYELATRLFGYFPQTRVMSAELQDSSDRALAYGKLVWNKVNTVRGTNDEPELRRDAHTKFAPTWNKGKQVVRTPTKYMRSVKDVYGALADISRNNAATGYQFTRATVAFSPIFNEAVAVMRNNAARAPAFFENNFGANSLEYRAQLHEKLVDVAQIPDQSPMRRPYAVAFAFIDTLREQFGSNDALAKVDELAPFLLYGLEQTKRATKTSSPQSENTNRRYVHNGARITDAPKVSVVPAPEPQRLEYVKNRPMVQIPYAPLMGGNGAF